MSILSPTPKQASKTLRVLARLLSYPDATLRKHLPELSAALVKEAALSPVRLAELEDLIQWMSAGASLQQALGIEEAYVELFDRGRATSLHLFEHVHGDSRDRGPAMIDLAQTLKKRACTWPQVRCQTTCLWCWNTHRPNPRRKRVPF